MGHERQEVTQSRVGMVLNARQQEVEGRGLEYTQQAAQRLQVLVGVVAVFRVSGQNLFSLGLGRVDDGEGLLDGLGVGCLTLLMAAL